VTTSLAQSLGGRSPDQWALDFLAAAGFVARPEAIRAVVSWEYAESGAGGGMFNPLNTTQGGFAGETDFNSVGVKNFVRYADGVAANAQVIRNGYYPHLVYELGLGVDARAICDAVTASPWGTGYIALVGAQPAPQPSPKGEPMLVASPHAPTLPGRVAAAYWAPGSPNVVLLTNGASIAHDVPGITGMRIWKPPVPAGATGIGIMATVGHDGKPDGAGVVLQDDKGDTYTGLWS
jgi:hypothetical protein